MATLNRDIVFNLFAKSQQFERAMGTAAGRLETVSAKFDAVGRKMSQFGSMATRRVTLPLVGLGAAAVNAASDQAEAFDKAQVIFGSYADEVLAWSKDAPAAMGLTSAAAVDAASNFQNMFTAQGLAAEQGKDMSTQLVQLAADMGSLNNVDPTDMLLKMQAALAGEVEPLRRFAVDVSAATVKAEAYRTGIAEVGEELTEQEKIQARFNIIMGQTANAQGNFAATADNMANATRTLKGEVGNLAAELGDQLLPIALDVVEWGGDMIEKWNDLDEDTQDLIVRMGLLAAAIGPVSRILGAIASHPVAAVLIGIGLAAVWAYQKFETFREVVDGVAQWFETKWNYVTSRFRWAWDDTWTWVEENWHKGVNVLIDLLNWILQKAQEVRNGLQWVQNIADFLVGPTINFTDIPNIDQLDYITSPYTPPAPTPGRSPYFGGLPGGGDMYSYNIDVGGTLVMQQDVEDFIRTMHDSVSRTGRRSDSDVTGRIGGR